MTYLSESKSIISFQNPIQVLIYLRSPLFFSSSPNCNQIIGSENDKKIVMMQYLSKPSFSFSSSLLTLSLSIPFLLKIPCYKSALVFFFKKLDFFLPNFLKISTNFLKHKNETLTLTLTLTLSSIHVSCDLGVMLGLFDCYCFYGFLRLVWLTRKSIDFFFSL